jgi:hypothetical protein
MNGLRMRKALIAALAVLLIGTNAWWLYHAVDHGVTLAYRDQMLYEMANRASALSEISSHFLKGKTRAEAAALLQGLFPADQPYEKEGALHTTWLSLQLGANGTVVGIEKNATLEHWVQSANTKNSPAGSPQGKASQ